MPTIGMFRSTRVVHRWIGVVAAVFFCVIAVTGFLLATKGTFGWIRPPEAKGAKLTSLGETVTLHTAAEAAFALGIAELKSIEDIDRMDYRPKSNVFKIISKEGYYEVQVDGSSGKVLQVARRNDQLAEDIHDLSFFNDLAKDWVLPLVAISLLSMAVTGLIIFFVPVVRRAKFKRSGGQTKNVDKLP